MEAAAINVQLAARTAVRPDFSSSGPGPSASPTFTPAPTSTPVPSATPGASASPGPQPSATPAATATPAPSATPAPTEPPGTAAAGCAPDNTDWTAYTPLIGSLHEHSGFSDGTIATEPRDYFAAAKAQGLDFIGSSEHSDNADIPLTVNTDCLSAQLPECLTLNPLDPVGSMLKWDATQVQARLASDAQFTASIALVRVAGLRISRRLISS